MLRIAKQQLRNFLGFARNETAATAVEYSLIAALMSMAGIFAFIALGDTLNDFWVGIDETIAEDG